MSHETEESQESRKDRALRWARAVPLLLGGVVALWIGVVQASPGLLIAGSGLILLARWSYFNALPLRPSEDRQATQTDREKQTPRGAGTIAVFLIVVGIAMAIVEGLN